VTRPRFRVHINGPLDNGLRHRPPTELSLRATHWGTFHPGCPYYLYGRPVRSDGPLQPDATHMCGRPLALCTEPGKVVRLMSENTSTTELTSHYTAQVTADLERNTKEQERISGEIALLSQQLAALQHDHIVLVNIHQAIGTIAPTPAPTVKTKPSGSPAVPSPRKKATPKTATSKQTRPKKTAPKAPATAAAMATPAPADKAEASKPAQPTVVDLVRGHLAEHSEPRSAAEITAALGQAHPARTFKTTGVRMTLEGLVAKSYAQRTKQGASVYYTAAEKAQSSEPSPTREQPAPVA
jgi:hypothetical protein